MWRRLDSCSTRGQIRGHTATVNILLDHGADVNHVTDAGLSALSLCLSLHHPDYGTRYHLDQLQAFTHLEVNDVSGSGGIPAGRWTEEDSWNAQVAKVCCFREFWTLFIGRLKLFSF